MIIHSILTGSEANGPGERLVIWLQGCKLACPGCWNQDTHAFKADKVFWPGDLAKLIVDSGMKGVTFSGGEPMHQAQGLSNTMWLVQLTRPDISFGVYTGYTEKELEAGNYIHPVSVLQPNGKLFPADRNAAWWDTIKKRLDFAVMGRYNQQKPCDLPLRSSSNQKLTLFSERYTEADFAPQTTEFFIDSDLIQITGFPKEEIYANA